MDIFNNATGDLLFHSLVRAGAGYALGCAALLFFLSLAGRQAGRHPENR